MGEIFILFLEKLVYFLHKCFCEHGTVDPVKDTLESQ